MVDLAHEQRLVGFRGLALADVGRDPDQPHRPTILVANDEAPVVQVHPMALGMAHTILAIEMADPGIVQQVAILGPRSAHPRDECSSSHQLRRLGNHLDEMPSTRSSPSERHVAPVSRSMS